jgi:LacI family transcriptional regulator
MAHRPTIKDVAKKANVSLSTVSLVINNKGYVSPETRSKVERVISELGFYPTSSARGLASRKSGNLGFIITLDHFTQAEPFYTKIFLGAEFEAQKYHYYILLTTVGRMFNPNKTVPRFLLEKNVDGVIVAGRIDQKLVDYIDSLNLPLVLIDYEFPRMRYSTILINNYKGAQQAVEHLLENDHKKIGFIGGDIKHPSIAQRFEGYSETLYSSGIEPDASWISVDQPDTGVDDGYNAAKKIFRQTANRPTAIFAANDAMAIGALKFFKELQIHVPQEISLVGFDNIEAGYRVEPKLTTVDVHKEEMGVMGVRTLVNTIKEGNGVVRNVHTSVDLIVRDSSINVKPKM